MNIEDICRSYGASILRRCCAILNTQEEAEDAVQDVFINIMRKRNQFRGDADIGAWIYRMTTNHCLNRLRSNKRRSERERADQVSAWSNTSVSDAYTAYTIKAQLDNLLHSMDNLNKEILVYRHLDGMTQDEIANVTSKSRKTIGKRLKCIKKIIKQQGVREL